MYEVKWFKAADESAVLILAHGAGAGSQSEFMQDMAGRLSQLGVSVVLFDFPYMQKQIALQTRRPPDRMPVLLDAMTAVIDTVTGTSHSPLWLGGKSMGGRVASMILASDTCPAGLMGGIVFGYPFHPPGKPDKLRTAHLPELNHPLLIVQGERDTFGGQHEVAGMTLGKQVTTMFIADGDHSLKPRKKSGLTEAQNRSCAADAAATFIKEAP